MPRSSRIAGARIDRICRSSRLIAWADETRNSAYHPARLPFVAGVSGSSAAVVAIYALSLAVRRSSNRLADCGPLALQRLRNRLADRCRRTAGEVAQVLTLAVELALAGQVAGAGQQGRHRRRQSG